jgi:hypothetical protein
MNMKRWLPCIGVLCVAGGFLCPVAWLLGISVLVASALMWL